MHRLAKLGFTQSYTYFTWRNTKHELTDYFTELTHGPGREYFRPNCWPNTPDILPEYLQFGGRAAFMARLVLAATLCGELRHLRPGVRAARSTPREPGSEEYLDSEKYELRHWDLERAGQPRRLHRARQRRAARQSGAAARRRARFLPDRQRRADLLRARSIRRGENAVLVVVNLDPHHAQSGWVTLDLAALGLDARPRVPGARPADRRALPVERRAQFRAARSGARAGACVPAAPARAHRARLRLLSLIRRWMHASRSDRKPRARRLSLPAAAPTPSRRLPTMRSGTRTPSSTSCTSRRSSTPTTTASAISAGSPRSSTTSRTSASTRSGCCRSIRRRCATTATTSPTTATSIRRTARAPTSSSSCARRTGASCASSPSSSSTTPPISIRGSRRRAARRRVRRSATSTSGATTRSKYAGTRIIFTDTEKSNWAWDDGRQGVLLASLLQPPARPQLRQPAGAARRSSASCASGSTWASTASGSTRFPTCASARARTTRTCPRRTRCSSRSARLVDAHYPNRLLLAEANQWPEDVREYFGDGDECHMAYHFPLMPRMYMAIAQEDRHPIVEIMAADARHPRATASGRSSCATTTS